MKKTFLVLLPMLLLIVSLAIPSAAAEFPRDAAECHMETELVSEHGDPPAKALSKEPAGSAPVGKTPEGSETEDTNFVGRTTVILVATILVVIVLILVLAAVAKSRRKRNNG